jgi:hypothetical protein
MMLVVLIAGIGLLLAGLVTAGLGVELDLSFGNTLLLTGTVVACTGVLMLGLWSAVRELKAIALGAGLPVEPRAGSILPSAGAALGDQAAEHGGLLFSRDQPGAEHAGQIEPVAPSPAPPWHEEVAPRDRGEAPGLASAGAQATVKPRRNLLFSSTSRKERERVEARVTEPSAADLRPGTLGPAPPPAEPGEAPPATFDDAWPKPGRARTPDVALPRRSARTPSAFPEAGAGSADRVSPGPTSEEQPQVTVLKSGVVDGMAYSLYSDGSIEAQMPEGMMRFASIEELRAHLDRRS